MILDLLPPINKKHSGYYGVIKCNNYFAEQNVPNCLS